MKKIIREVDKQRGIVQITVADERWYTKPSQDPETAIPVYLPVPSVTWIAGYWPKGVGFYKWLADKGWDEAEAAKQAAGDKGSVVHKACEIILEGEEFRIDTKVPDKGRSTEQEMATRELTYEELLCVKSFIDWRKEIEKDYTIETLASEKTLMSDIHNCGGTIDWLVRLTPKEGGANPLKLAGPTVYLIDFKTSKQIWTEYEIQVSAYGEFVSNGENPIVKRNANGTETNQLEDISSLRLAILQLGYDKNRNGYKFTELENAFHLFKVAQQIWQREIGKNTPGFTVRDFPIVLSPATKKAEAATEAVSGLFPEEKGTAKLSTEAEAVESRPSKKTKKE